ncbi:rhodanese-like domain-containing protein [Streptomyces sp. NPDC001750]|uniref:rhodanese-like domain-containing protein n=1 Tax=Streptomyces sp. NPDC001750 TaxID=3364607 RepID=UPI0036810F6B
MSLFGRDRSGPERVTAQEAAARTGHARAAGSTAASAACGTCVLLDVREPHEWQAGHAPDAVHLPLAMLTADAALPTEARARPVVVICRSGNRSRQAVELLRARGIEAVDVIGGMREWAEAGFPVVSSLPVEDGPPGGDSQDIGSPPGGDPRGGNGTSL